MLICICKNVSHKKIETLKKEGKNIEEILEETEAGSDCGRCLCLIEEIIDRK